MHSGSYGSSINRSNVIALVAVHGAALGAFWTFTVEGLVCCLVMIMLTLNVGILLGFHRLLTHRSLRVPRNVCRPGWAHHMGRPPQKASRPFGSAG